MMICFICKHCHKESQIKTVARDRYELSLNQGAFLNVECYHCKEINSTHVNKTYAKEDQKRLLIILFISIILSFSIGFALYNNYWGGDIGIKSRLVEAIAVGCLIPFLVWNTFREIEIRKSRSFNSFRL
jgi:hypothetical protein